MRYVIVMISVLLLLFSAGMNAEMAFAAQDQTIFIAHYERNAATEAKLLATAQATQVNMAIATSLQTLVDNLNQQIASMYTMEQETTNTATISTVQGTIASTLYNERRQLQKKAQQEAAQIKKDRKMHQPALLQSMQMQHRQTLVQLKKVIQESNQLGKATNWNQHPYAKGLSDLQSSILNLQAAVIHYTHLWIVAESLSSGS